MRILICGVGRADGSRERPVTGSAKPVAIAGLRWWVLLRSTHRYVVTEWSQFARKRRSCDRLFLV